MIHSTTKKTELVCLYIFYRPNKNASRTDQTNDDQKAYAFAPTYGDGSTDFHYHMISVVVISYSNTRQSMLADYVAIEMGCFDDYLDAAPHAKKMRGNGITTFILHVAQCITFNQTMFLQQHLLPMHGWSNYIQVKVSRLLKTLRHLLI